MISNSSLRCVHRREQCLAVVNIKHKMDITALVISRDCSVIEIFNDIDKSDNCRPSWCSDSGLIPFVLAMNEQVSLIVLHTEGTTARMLAEVNTIAELARRSRLPVYILSNDLSVCWVARLLSVDGVIGVGCSLNPQTIASDLRRFSDRNREDTKTISTGRYRELFASLSNDDQEGEVKV